MQSHGGVAPVRESTRLAAGAVLSGPAGGVAAGRYCARLLGRGEPDHLRHGRDVDRHRAPAGGEPQLTGEKTVGVAKVALPAIDIHTLGAGGGSVAWVDAGRILHVGPESAGAEPGPACYGKGGTRATVTDANLVLGFLDPGSFLGGRIRLDANAARAAVERIATAARRRRLSRGGRHHPRRQHQHGRGHQDRLRCAAASTRASSRCVAFGGAAGLHITEVARLLEIRRVVVPSVAARAVGVGHAGDRPALRAGALARERGAAG